MPVTEEERREYEDKMEAEGKKRAEEKKKQKEEYDAEFKKLHDKASNDHIEAIQKWQVDTFDYEDGPLAAFKNAVAVADANHVNKNSRTYYPKLRVKAPKKPVFKEAVVPNARRRFPLLDDSYFHSGGRRRTRRGRKTRSTRRR